MSPEVESVLVTLADSSPRYGLDISKASDGLIPRWKTYVVLSRIEDEGLIASEPDGTQGDGPKRRLYWITSLGRSALAELHFERAKR